MFVVCNDPTEYGEVFLTPLCTVRPNDPQVDHACVLEPFQYSKITEQTYIAYRHAKVYKADDLRRKIEDGIVNVFDDINTAAFLMVRNGIKRSEKIKPKTRKQWEDINRLSDSYRQIDKAR